MHELSIAQALVEQIKEAANNAGGGTVSSARIVVGGLSGVDAEALRFAFPIATDGTDLADTELIIEEDPAIIACKDCGVSSTPDFPFPVCPACESTNVTVEGGQSLLLASIELAQG